MQLEDLDVQSRRLLQEIVRGGKINANSDGAQVAILQALDLIHEAEVPAGTDEKDELLMLLKETEDRRWYEATAAGKALLA